MKIAAALVLALVVVLTGAAHAVPLRITQGEIVSIEVATDTFLSFAGDGFAADAVCLGCNTVTAGDLSSGRALVSGTATLTGVRVGALTCDALMDDCGAFLQLTNTPIPTPDDPITERTVRLAPFTAIGQLFVSGETFDVVGRGIVGATWCPQGGCGPGGNFPFLNVGYTFSVDEPPTLLLVVASFGVLGALVSARFLRDRYAARLPQHPK
jgi:hypothetical protein